MRKYFATILGVAIGIATAVVMAARAEDGAAPAPHRREGGA